VRLAEFWDVPSDAVGRWTGSWLGGPSSAGLTPPREDWPGERLGLPEEGVASVAPVGRRIAAFAVDALGSALVAGLFTLPDPPGNVSLLVFFVVYVLFTSLLGQTPGMYVTGLRVVRIDTRGPLGIVRALIRTVLLCLLIPALIWDRDNRGLHDKASAAVVVRAR
jgi:uncharacterized RDD family membrane protein YckC